MIASLDEVVLMSVDINLEWERWGFPIHVEVDLKSTVLENIREQMSGAIGFDPASLEAAAKWCADNEINYTEAGPSGRRPGVSVKTRGRP